MALGGGAAAHAQETATDAEAHARFDAGRLAFDAGHFEDALSDFRRAYELSHRPELLYNIGETSGRLERRADALEAFEQYLRESPPDAPHRQQVEARIAILRAALAPAETVEADEAEHVDPPPPPPERSADPAPWAVLGVSGAVVVAGAVLVGVAEADRAALEGARPPTYYTDAAAAADRVPVLEGAGIAALSVGVVGCVAAIVWGVIGSGSAERDAVALDAQGLRIRW